MTNTELAIKRLDPFSLAQQEAEELALVIESAYNPFHNGELDSDQLSTALKGVLHAEHILVGQEATKSTAVLGASVYTRENHPEFYAVIAEKIAAIDDENLSYNVATLMEQIDALMYTHEMVSLRRGRGDIAKLREHVLQEAGFDLRTDKIALFGEFQGLDSIGVQRGLPNSISLLAGIHVPPKGENRQLPETELAAFRTLTRIVGETFLATYHPQTIVHENGTVESEVFDTPPRRSRHITHINELEVNNAIQTLQKKLGGKGFASGIGATYLNLRPTN